MQTKKIINNGDDAVDEMLDGILLAHGDTLRASDESPRAIIARNPTNPPIATRMASARDQPRWSSSERSSMTRANPSMIKKRNTDKANGARMSRPS